MDSKLCHIVDFNDGHIHVNMDLKGIFRNGLNYFLCYLMPESTVPWILAKYIAYALLLAGSSFTVGFSDEGLHNPTILTTPECLHDHHVGSYPCHSCPATACSLPASPAYRLITSLVSSYRPFTSCLPFQSLIPRCPPCLSLALRWSPNLGLQLRWPPCLIPQLRWLSHLSLQPRRLPHQSFQSVQH